MRPLAIITLFALSCGRIFAQAADTITFEAASVKPFAEGTPIMMSGGLGGPGSDDPGRINCEYTTLKMLLMRAYKVKSDEIFGPGWLESAHFNITAKLPEGATKEQVPVMFRNLLAERFKVVLHHENRALPAYSLTVAKGGLKIKESAQAPSVPAADDAQAGGRLPIGKDGFPVLRPGTTAGGPITLFRQGQARLQASHTTLAALAEALTQQLGRVVIDETGLGGRYDITLNWTPEATEPGGRPRQAASAGTGDIASQEAGTPDTNLYAAVEQQLGLKLISKKTIRDTIVIDRAEKVPTEN
jgi:uncharacterized protein (TIGR03435 family)